MKQTRLIIKYKDSYICDKSNGKISFINIPFYHKFSADFNYIDIFVSLLCDGSLNERYESTRSYTWLEGLEIFECFAPECITQLDEDVFLYDLDDVLLDVPDYFKNKCTKNLQSLPGNLSLYSLDELIQMNNKQDSALHSASEEDAVDFSFKEYIDLDLLNILKMLNMRRTDKDVLLLYSGGKDSTLSAIRLRNAGYNVYFMHCDNGHMVDQDKPFLTFKKTFLKSDGYYFGYQNNSVDIKEDFNEYFMPYQTMENLKNDILDSEIQCLSCRMAMYTSALEYAIEHRFKYIADGARISQKFMIEQPILIEEFQNLASLYGITLLYPVLELNSDELLKSELISNGFSSKSWESKCLIGLPTRDKTSEEETAIVSYFGDVIKPKMEKKLNLVN